MNRFLLAASLATATAITGCGQTSVFASDKSEAFARIETGVSTPSPRNRIVELMGNPTGQSARVLLGVSHECLTFQDGRHTYTVTLINGVAVWKTTQPRKEKS